MKLEANDQLQHVSGADHHEEIGAIVDIHMQDDQSGSHV